ncbi:MAG: prepilin peptidase [Limnohabitans sp.]
MTPELPAIAFMAVLGLAVGSFVNVLIHRLPIMIEQSWHEPASTDAPALNLAFPASHCPSCKHTIAWYDNLPVLGFALLGGRCRHCRIRISWQYPLIELTNAALFVWSMITHADWPSALAWAAFAAALLALAVIDARTTWLPDAITQPLTWGGLIASAMGWTTVTLPSALTGAVVGYLCLWTLYWGFLLVTGKEGMGHGDFKLLAALGAWFGWQHLLALILLASVSALAVALAMLWRKSLPDNRQIAFGPFLALAGGWMLFFGPPGLLKL